MNLFFPPRHKKFSKYLTVFGFLVLKSSDADRKVMVGCSEIQLKPRQLVTCFREISEACGIGEESARWSLNKMEDQGIITRESNNQYSLITIQKVALPQEC